MASPKKRTRPSRAKKKPEPKAKKEDPLTPPPPLALPNPYPRTALPAVASRPQTRPPLVLRKIQETTVQQPTKKSPSPEEKPVDLGVATTPTRMPDPDAVLVRNTLKGMTVIEMAGGIERYINVAARLLKHNLEGDRAQKIEEHLPVVCVRNASNTENVLVFDEVEVLGPTHIGYTPNDPLPGTNGRGIAYIVTRSPVRGYLRPGELAPKMEHWLP